MNKEIFILIDYRDQFYFSTRYRGACVDISKLETYFRKAGYKTIVKRFSEIDLRKENYKDKWVLYQSSEDPSLHYKDYIEDILLALELQGAKLIPRFTYFRAHHNKVFMELLRDTSDIQEIKNITSKTFGTFEEYSNSSSFKDTHPLVLKPGSGTRSTGVKLLNSNFKKRVYPYQASRTFTFDNLRLSLSKIHTGKPFTPMSNNRQKFVIQNFISGLHGDYRILVYGEKFYVVFRKNRDDDFRASGSGKLDFEAAIPAGLLDYAKTIYLQFDTPFVSLDIGHKDGEFYLFEFQCLCLGQYTLEKSKFYYNQRAPGSWERVCESPDLEREISSAVLSYITRHI